MMKHAHGGNIYKYRDCLDFSANLNPLGTPENVKDAIYKSLDNISCYPEVGYSTLRNAIAAYENVDAENIICGNGAAEIIFMLCNAIKPCKALLPVPTFAEYEQALRSCACDVEYFYLKEESGFKLQQDFIDSLHKGIDIVFLCNPNNPTGVSLSREFLFQILRVCREMNIFLVVDECFLDFVFDPSELSLKSQLSRYHNLFLLKAFTKRYAMAGVRLGYGLTGNIKLLKDMANTVQPWNISVMATAAGIAALKENDYVEAGRQVVFSEKEYLKNELERIGMHVFSSEANYLFFRGPENLFEICLEQKVLIRDCSNYPGLKKGYFRVAVKKHEENEILIKAIKDGTTKAAVAHADKLGQMADL